ncbi:metallophosphoesterase [uncultured Maribacter sp.]|uniref:metallophosphoesterase family protein n=1 Tax=uncultured Maribacter sp. TaxID=431308 RepID=UPI0030EED76C|tara:strand:- start:21701 stop:22708 length:1008 start_codon:yes stop_codon:yes gene_type:complete
MGRRKFIGQIGAGMTASLLPYTGLSFSPSYLRETGADILRFGIVTDVHKDLIPDANERLEKFIDKAQRENVDFIIQLGDFCMGDSKNNDFLSIWESFKGLKYHVLGNHDMDKNSKREMLDFWGMPKTYYSYDFQGIHFIVLDANFLYQDGKFTDYDKANFYVDSKIRTFINEEQIEWFKGDLEETKLPTIIFSHQSLWHYEWGVKNRLALQRIMESQSEKIICCMNGHNHIDFHRHQNGIDYIEVNSMSYQWMGDKYTSTKHFPEQYYREYGSLPHIAPYKDPLYAFATVDLKGHMLIEGVKSDWVSPSPAEMGMPNGIYGLEYSATMSDYKIKF